MANRLMTPDKIQALRADIAQRIDEHGHFKEGAGPELAKKYGILDSLVAYHRRAHLEGKGTRAKRSMVGLNEDIVAGMPEQQLRRKYNIPQDGRVKPQGRPPAEELKPMTKAECLKVAKLLTRLAETKPDVFTQLDIVGNISRKYPRIWAELL